MGASKDLFDRDHVFAVGEEVLITNTNDRGRPPREGVVEKVGRKLIYVSLHGTRTGQHVFRLDREYGRPSNDGYGHGTVWLPHELENRKRHKELLETLRELGIEPRNYRGNHLSIDTLTRLIAVLRDEGVQQ